MVINKFVHVEGSKDVECMAKVEMRTMVMARHWGFSKQHPTSEN